MVRPAIIATRPEFEVSAPGSARSAFQSRWEFCSSDTGSLSVRCHSPQECVRPITLSSGRAVPTCVTMPTPALKVVRLLPATASLSVTALTAFAASRRNGSGLHRDYRLVSKRRPAGHAAFNPGMLPHCHTCIRPFGRRV